MTKRLILVVEDNPDLRRHLRIRLEEYGFECELARNEIEAIVKVTDRLLAVIADIDLSETGGSGIGGIELAKRIASKGIDIPVILISQTPATYQPYKREEPELKIAKVLDRNDDSFWERLSRCLNEISSET